MSKSEDRRRRRIDEDEEDGDAAMVDVDESSSRRASKRRDVDNIDDLLNEDDHDDDQHESDDDDESDEEEGDEDEEEAEDDGEFKPSDGFDEHYLGDARDRAALNAMSEVAREEIILQRVEARDKERERWEANKGKHKGKEKKPKDKKKKKKASKKKKKKDKESKEKEESKPSKRGSSAPKKRTAQDALQDLLARKSHKSTNKASDRVGADQQEDDEEEDDDFDDEMDDDEPSASARKKHRKSRGRSTDDGYVEDEDVKDVADAGDEAAHEDEKRTPITLAHVRGIQLRRVALEKIIDEPYFNDVVTNMFVRVNIGTRDDGKPAYRMCQVGGVEEWKSKYKFGQPPRDVKVALLLKLGKAERLWSCALISNQTILEEEFQRWQQQMVADGLTPLSAEEAMRLKRRATKIRQDFKYTPEVLKKLIDERRLAGKTISRSSNLTAERSRLTFELMKARDAQAAPEVISRLERQLEDLDEAQKKLQELEAAKSSAAQARSIAEINERNIRENTARMEEMLRVQREEKRRAMEEARRLQELSGGVIQPTQPQRDAFKRKETRPTMEFIADAEKIAAQQKAEAERKKKEKEEEDKKKAAAEAERRAREKRHKLEQFDDIPMLDDTEVASSAPQNDGSGGGSTFQVSNSRTLHLPHLPSVSDKLLALLQRAHHQVDDTLAIDPHAAHPTTLLPTVLGRFVTTQGGLSQTPLTSSRNAEYSQWTQRPSGRIFTIEEYCHERGMA